tara:strand:- start:2571 stop:5879 length:3309 start_codon:yes stop_codon:yes gene_type:complete
MLQLQLYIKTPFDGNDDYERIEMFKDESVTLTQNIQDVKDISKIFTDYSQTFSVPASRHNNKVFKHFYNYFINGFDAREKKDAKLFLNEKPFKTGKIKLEGSTLKGNKPNTYKLTFYGSVVNLKDLLGDIKINGLAYFNDSVFTYSAANVKTLLGDAASLNVSGTTWADSLLFPLITHTDRLYYDTGSDGANTEGLANVRWNAAGNTAQGLNYTQLKPAIRVYTILKAIEYQFPEIVFGTDFINTTNTDLYDLFIWLNIKEGDLIQTTDTTYNAFSPNTNIEKNNKAESKRMEFCDVFSNGSFNVLQGRKTKRLTASFTSSGVGEYSVVVKNNGELVAEHDGLTGSSSPIVNLELQTGRYTIQVGGTVAATFTSEFKVDALYSGKDAIVTWKSTASILSSQRVWIKDHLPEINILNFLTGIFKMFNLTAYVDDNGITQVQTLDSFYEGTTNTPIEYYDITKNVDVKKSQIDIVLPFNQINFKYEGTKSFLANDHKNRFGKTWGSLEYKNEVFDGETYEVKLPFGHFKYERLYNQTGGTSTTIMYGWSVDESKKAIVPKPLLFYPILASSVSVGQTPTSISYIGDSGHEEVASYYLPSNSKSFSSVSAGVDISNNINFNAEMNEYSLRPFDKTLFKQYYETYIKDIFKPERRLTKLSAFIPLAILSILKLYDRLIIDDKVYKINKLTTNFQNESSQLELINVFDDRELVQNLNQAVATIDADLSGIGITADSNLVTADAGLDYEEIIQIPIKEVPDTIPDNVPDTTNNIPCVVTAATLSQPTQKTNTNSTLFFSHNITAMGKICEVNNLESYGFIHSTAEANLIDDSLDVLIARVANTTILYNAINPQATANIKTYTAEVTGLSQNTVKYWIFFARTNTTSNFDKVDATSNIYSSIAAATPPQVETTNGKRYHPAVAQDNEIRTIRIMDKDQNLVNFTGIRGYPSFIDSKIVPFVVSGLPMSWQEIVDLTADFVHSLGMYHSNGIYYHATDLSAVVNAAKAASIGNTGATSGNFMSVSLGTGDYVFAGLDYLGVSLYANSTTAVKEPDGYYGTRLSDAWSVQTDAINNVEGSWIKDASWTYSNVPRIKVVQVVGGYITSGNIY